MVGVAWCEPCAGGPARALAGVLAGVLVGVLVGVMAGLKLISGCGASSRGGEATSPAGLACREGMGCTEPSPAELEGLL